MADPLRLQPPDSNPDVVMDEHDRGWRKFGLVVFIVVLLSMGAIAIHWWTDWTKPYETWGGFLIDILAIYVIGNVGYKGLAGYMNGKFSPPASTTKTIPPGDNG